MRTYFRLLRLDEHYPILGVVTASALYIHMRGWWVLWWTLGAICISIAVFIVNELVDREDTDKYSWNKIHIGAKTRLEMKIVAPMILLFSLFGFVFSAIGGFFIWSILLFTIGMLYSVKPIRLKARFGLDIVAQIVCAFAIPFVAVLSVFNKVTIDSLFLCACICILLWSVIFPYQLADFDADKKAGLKNTHSILGMKYSLVFGLFLALVGMFTYLVLRVGIVAPWSYILLPLVTFSIFKYFKWLQMKTLKAQTTSMQRYVLLVKPLSQLLIPYFLAWFVFFF